MKKLMLVVVVVFLMVSAALVSAQEPVAKKVDVLIDLRNDFVASEKSSNKTIQAATVWVQGKLVGGILEPEYCSKTHYEKIKGSLLLKQGSWYFLAGATSDSLGNDFVQAGIWYVGKVGKANVLVDARNYWSTSGRDNGYTDNLLRVMYPIGKGFSVGMDFAYDHWWSSPSHDWYCVGPRISYKVTENISVYARVSRDWNVVSGEAEKTDKIRVGLSLTF